MLLRAQVSIQRAWWRTRDRLREHDWRSDAGMTTETVIITAVLALLALTVTAIIVRKVVDKANSIPVDSPPGAGS